MGIVDILSKIFNKDKDNDKESSTDNEKYSRKNILDRIDSPITEDIEMLKTENITDSSKSQDMKNTKNEKKNSTNQSELNLQKVSDAKIMDVLSNVYDPEIPIDIVNLGLIYDVDINGGIVDIKMTMTAPGCPASAQITSEAKCLIEEIEGVTEANIEIVWDPPWDPGRMSEEAKQSLGYD